MPGHYQMTRETDENIVQLLAAVGFPDGKFSPLTVITNDYGLWVSQFPRQSMTLLDVSLLAPPQTGRVPILESEIEREVMRRLLSVGWPRERIIEQFVLNSGARADFGLIGNDGKIVAIVEVKGAPLLGMSLEQAQRMAKLAGVRYAILTNGRQFLLHDCQCDVVLERSILPSPAELSLEAPPMDVYRLASTDSPLSVVTSFDFQELLESIRRSRESTLVIDHTIPWGTRIPDLLANELSEGLGKADRMDFPGAFLGVAASRAPSGQIIAFNLPNICFSVVCNELRQFILERLHLATVIDLPPNLFRPLTSVKSVIIKLVPREDETPKATYFFSLPSANELSALNTQPWFPEFQKGMRGKESKVGFYAKVATGESWTLEAHRPAIKGAQEKIAKYAEVAPLGDLYDVLPGFRHSREEAQTGKGIPVVRGRDLATGVESLGQLTRYKLSIDPPEHTRIRERDLLIQRIGETPTCIVAPSSLVGAVASDTIFILRRKSEDADPNLLSQFLSSSEGWNVLASRLKGAGAPTLSTLTLRTLPIPVLKGTIARDLQELLNAEQVLRAKVEKLEALRLSVFSAESSLDLETRLREIRQTSGSVQASTKQAESLSFRIRNFYPYPLAFAYRLLVAINNPAELYSQQLRVAENILAFLASVGLAVVDERDRVKCEVEVTQYWRGGISPGGWRELSQKTVKILKGYPDNRLAQSLTALWSDTKKNGFYSRIEQLITSKNDMKHDRGPKTEDDISAAAQEIGETLDNCMLKLAFLTEHPIRLVRDMDVARGTRSVALHTLRCEGDHPGFTQERIQYPEPLTKNDLYLEVEPGRWSPLFPFLVARNCQLCKSREIYFIDKWNDKGKGTLLKSFERGHSMDDSDTAHGLEAWAHI